MSDTNFKFNTSKTECLILPALPNLSFPPDFKISTHFVTQTVCWVTSSSHLSLSKYNMPPRSLKYISKMFSHSLHLYFNTIEHVFISHCCLCNSLLKLNAQLPFYSPPIDFLYENDLLKI